MTLGLRGLGLQGLGLSGRPSPAKPPVKQEKTMITLGVTARDLITGFKGIVTGRAEYLTGCDQYLLNPPAKDGALVEAQWFDEQRLAVEQGPVVELDNSRGNGADRAAPKR